MRQRQRLAASDGSTASHIELSNIEDIPSDLPACPSGLSRDVQERWLNLVMDMVAAGIVVKQIDVRAIAVAARYEQSLVMLDEMCERNEKVAEQDPLREYELRVQALRTRLATMKDYLAALERIGGTPLVRLRAKINPDDKPDKKPDDPWVGM